MAAEQALRDNLRSRGLDDEDIDPIVPATGKRGRMTVDPQVSVLLYSSILSRMNALRYTKNSQVGRGFISS